MNTEFKIGSAVIDTNRLIMRSWKNSDLYDLHEYASIEGFGESAGLSPHKTIEETKKVLNGYITGNHVFAVILKENNKIIGSVGVGEVSDDEHKDYIQKGIGYVLRRNYWGSGIMTEAVRAVTEWLFENTDIEILSCGFFEGNDRSRRVMEKCGFKFAKTEVFNQGDEILHGRSYILFKGDIIK